MPHSTTTSTTTTTNSNNGRRSNKTKPNTPNPNAPAKRTHVPLDDGWTLVSTTKSAAGRGRSSNNSRNMRSGGGYSGLSAAGLAAAHTPAGPARVMPGTDKARLMERLEAFRERWAECACREGIRAVLGRAGVGEAVVESVEGEGEGAGAKAAEQATRIAKAVCIGLGSLSVDNVAAGVRSMWQLVCFLDIVGMLGAGPDAPPIALYAEDPVFNPLDEDILAELGVTIVQGRRSADGSRQEGAAQFIERDTLVFAPFMPSFMVLEDFLADRNPAIYIGNDVQATLELARTQVRYR